MIFESGLKYFLKKIYIKIIFDINPSKQHKKYKIIYFIK